jgi:hypothetical protein
MNDTTLVKFMAMASGMLFLAVLAGVCAAHGYRVAEQNALAGLGACVVCYGAQMAMHRRVFLVIAYGASIASWALGVAAAINYLGRG